MSAISTDGTYRYINLEGKWPLVTRDGLVVGSDGALSLAPLPSLTPLGTAPILPVEGLSGPFGVGVDPCGDLYVADPSVNRILRIDGCDGSVSPLRCFGRLGSDPGMLNTPRGVVVTATHELLVADSGNHRIQRLDLATGQLLGVWDIRNGLTEPWDLAVDSAGAIYVADMGTLQADGTRAGGTIVKLDEHGTRSTSFAATLATQTQPGAPIGVAVAVIGDDPQAERLVVLDSQPSRILVYALDGTLDSDATTRWSALLAAVGSPVAVTASSDRLYVADAANARVLVFDLDGNFLGSSAATGGSVAGLALDCHGRLVVHPGSGGSLQLGSAQPTYSTCGTFLAGPFEAPSDPTVWWQLRATIDALPDLAHVRFFAYTSDTMDGSAGNRPSMPVTCADPDISALVGPDAVDLAPVDTWRAAPWDATELLILNEPASYLWLACMMQSDGSATPVLRNLRLDFDTRSWLRYLPSMFARDDTSRVFLERALALFQVPFDDEAALIDDIALLIDPYASPDTPPRPTWLDWLSDWVCADLEESWDSTTRRHVVADAFKRYATRGTKETIRDLVQLHTGVTPRIQELFMPSVWSLGGTLGLGFGTMLSPEPAEGAVLGSTAIVDHSRMLNDDEYGVSVFEDVAHRFLVWIYSADMASPDVERAVRRMLDREKPAHTTYELCVIEPRMRVGVQSLVGVDAIVGGPPLGAALDGTRQLGADSVLPGSRREGRPGGIIGDDARVGMQATVA